MNLSYIAACVVLLSQYSIYAHHLLTYLLAHYITLRYQERNFGPDVAIPSKGLTDKRIETFDAAT